jgi:hypothetical protein
LDGGETLVASGVTDALAGGATQSDITIGGTWPYDGSWYLIVQLEATDEVTTNNEEYAGPFTVYDPPDYEVDPASVVLPVIDNAVWSLVGEQLSVIGPGSHEFRIHEIAGNNGNQPIDWSVYVSTDTVYDAGDVPIFSGQISPLSAFGSSTLITFDDTIDYPSGHHFLLIRVESGDDLSALNDVYASVSALPVMDNRGFADTTNLDTDTAGDANRNEGDDFAIWLDSAETIQRKPPIRCTSKGSSIPEPAATISK